MTKENGNELDSWVTIEKYPQYQVNPMGQIRNTKTGNIIKAYRKYRRYIIHIIDDNGKNVEPDVDRIVADTFLPRLTDNTNMLLKHLDGNLNNCCVDNLAWVDDDTAEKEYYSTHSIRKPKEYFEFYPLLEWPEGYYEINKMGQIRNKNKHRLVKEHLHDDGYTFYTLKINGKTTMRYTHVLVAKQFIPNPENKPIINHIDEDKTNPCIDNLEWVTRNENIRHGTGISRANLGKNKLMNEYDVHGKYIRTWKSIRICADFFDTLYPNRSNISAIRSILSFNSRNNTEKKVFANRVFMYYKGNCDDIHFELCTQKARKYKDVSLDGIVVPNEYLVDDNDNLILLSILKKMPSSKLGLTKIQRDALQYAIKCAEIVEHNKSK